MCSKAWCSLLCFGRHALSQASYLYHPPRFTFAVKCIQLHGAITLIKFWLMVQSQESATLIDVQTTALFGNLRDLQVQMQNAVGQDATSVEELMQKVQVCLHEPFAPNLKHSFFAYVADKRLHDIFTSKLAMFCIWF